MRARARACTHSFITSHSAPIARNATHHTPRRVVRALTLSTWPARLTGEWRDVETSVKFRLPEGSATNLSGCVGNRVDQMWHYGVVFCVSASGKWVLSYGGPALGGQYDPANVIKTGALSAPLPAAAWTTISLTTVDTTASATCNGKAIVEGAAIRNTDCGFSALGKQYSRKSCVALLAQTCKHEYVLAQRCST
jgi:hypothetical protein